MNTPVVKRQIVTYWQEAVVEYLGKPFAPLNAKELGQLKTLYRKTGVLAECIVEFAFRYWPELTDTIMSSTGVPCRPSQPHIGYLLTHWKTAILLMLKMELLDPDSANAALLGVSKIK